MSEQPTTVTAGEVTPSATNALEAHGVHKVFGGVAAVNDVSISVKSRSITAVIGPNGAGKTSLFNVLTGFDKADSGSISLFGESIGSLPAWRIARKGMVRSFQTPVGFPSLTVWENLMTSGATTHSESLLNALFNRSGWRKGELKTHAQASIVMDELGLAQHRDTLIEDLAAGDVKLVDFGRLQMMAPKVLLLDEPAAGVPPSGIERLTTQVKALRDSGISLLIIDHNIQFVFSVADYIYVMAEGRVVVQGTPAKIATDETVASIYLGGSK